MNIMIFLLLLFIQHCLCDSYYSETLPPYAFCGDGVCEGGETCHSCLFDCGMCSPADPYCGDGFCDSGEDCINCPFDCMDCLILYCGDGICDSNEDCIHCPKDCGNCPTSTPSGTQPPSGTNPLSNTTVNLIESDTPSNIVKSDTIVSAGQMEAINGSIIGLVLGIIAFIAVIKYIRKQKKEVIEKEKKVEEFTYTNAFVEEKIGPESINENQESRQYIPSINNKRISLPLEEGERSISAHKMREPLETVKYNYRPIQIQRSQKGSTMGQNMLTTENMKTEENVNYTTNILQQHKRYTLEKSKTPPRPPTLVESFVHADK